MSLLCRHCWSQYKIFQTGIDLLPEWCHYQLKYEVFRPEVTGFRYDVTSGGSIKFFIQKWRTSGVTSLPVDKMSFFNRKWRASCTTSCPVEACIFQIKSYRFPVWLRDLPIKWHFLTGSGVFPVRRHAQSRNKIFEPGLTDFRDDTSCNGYMKRYEWKRRISCITPLLHPTKCSRE